MMNTTGETKMKKKRRSKEHISNHDLILQEFTKEERLILLSCKTEICESLKDGKDRLVVINTCGFDSIVQLFAAACTHSFFYDTLIKANTSDIFQFIKNFIDKGPCKSLYRQRATLLRKIEYFVSKNAFNVITINALSNISNLCEFLLSEQPSCTLLKKCDTCKKTTTRNLILLNLDFETIQSHGYNTIVQAINNYTTSNYKQCRQCGKDIKLKIDYHSNLLIECIGDANINVPLKTFPKTTTRERIIFFNWCSALQ